MNHLTDSQFAEILSGTPDAQSSAHLAECAACATEIKNVRATIGALRAEMMSTPVPVLRPVATIGRHRGALWTFAFAPAAAVIVVAVALLTFTPAPQPQPVAVAPDPDEALLLEIQNDLYSDVPQALVPAAAISFERNRMADTAVR